MSFSSEEPVVCPCGDEFMAVVWNSVNARQDPRLKEEILAGQLNLLPCPTCGGYVYAERLVIYHDPDAELMAFAYPKSHEKDRPVWEQKTARDMEESQKVEGGARLAYPALVLFGLETLVGLLEREQEAEDQAAILRHLARRAGLKVLELPPAKARATGVPRVLPIEKSEGTPSASGMASALKTVLAANDRLTVYAELLKTVESGRFPPNVLPTSRP